MVRSAVDRSAVDRYLVDIGGQIGGRQVVSGHKWAGRRYTGR